MNLTLKVTTKAKFNKIEKLSDTNYKVWVSAAADKGKANAAVIKLLSEQLKIPPSRLVIAHGATSRQKIVEIVS
jgi:uncharacterized protein YggU (UPF0235/DUF167 family)